MKPSNSGELGSLLDAKAYEKVVEEAGGTDMPFIPHTETDVREMLAAIGATEHRCTCSKRFPPQLRIKSLAGIPEALTEMEVGRLMQQRAGARRPAAQLPRRRRV